MGDRLRIDDGHERTGAEIYLARPMPRSKWGRRARVAIREVLEVLALAAPDLDAKSILERVDAAYPFGERAHEPYKRWLEERRLLASDLRPGPSADEWAAIEVAGDMLEEGRPVAEILALLDEQASNRHVRPCPTCGRGANRPCYEPGAAALTFGSGRTMPLGPDRLIPHAARVQP